LQEQVRSQQEVIEQQAERKCCPACQEGILAPFPEDVPSQDETGLWVAGKRHRVHVSATPPLTHDAAHTKRGKKALTPSAFCRGFAASVCMTAGAPIFFYLFNFLRYITQHKCMSNTGS